MDDVLPTMPRRSSERSFRFELTPNDAHEDARGGGRGRAGGRRPDKRGRGTGGGRGRGGVKLRNDDDAEWLSVSFECLCALVPHVPPNVVVATCEREKARGATVQDAIDAL